MQTTKIHIIIIMVLFCAACTKAVAQFHISPGSALTIKDGSTLFVDADFTISSNSISSGYFVDQTLNNGVMITGSVLVERFIAANGWHNIAAPLSNAHSQLFTGTDLFFYYNETIVQNDWNFGWVWYSGQLDAMRGYDVYISGSPLTVQYASADPAHLNAGQYTIAVTNTNVPDGEIPEHKGWNLVGNPYPSPVDWLAGTGWGKSPINDAKYIWDPSAEVYTIFIGGPDPIGLNGGTRFIPSNQGFWVQALQNGNIQVNNAARVGEMTSTPDFYKSSEASYPLIRLIATGNGYSDETLIRFIDGANSGFDRNYDALKLFSPGANAPQIASIMEKKYYGINTLGNIEKGFEIPLFFASKNEGSFSIAISTCSSLESLGPIYLRDHKLGHNSLLDKGLSYSFDYLPTDVATRFSVLVDPSMQQLSGRETRFGIHSHRSVVYITDYLQTEARVDISIYNILGQCVWREAVTILNSHFFNPNLKPGTYIVTVGSNEVLNQGKVLLNQ